MVMGGSGAVQPDSNSDPLNFNGPRPGSKTLGFKVFRPRITKSDGSRVLNASKKSLVIVIF